MATQRIKIIWLVIAALALLAGLAGYLIGGNADDQIVINQREEVIIDEGINNVDVANATRASLVMIYNRTGSATGVVVTSDGVVALPAAALEARGPLSAVLEDGRVSPAKFLAEDEIAGLMFLQIEEKNLPVARQGFAGETRAAERVLYIAASSIPRSAEIGAALVARPAYPEPGLTKLYDLERPNASLKLDPAASLDRLGALVVNRDGAVIGFVTRINNEITVLRAEDYKLAIDRFLNKEKPHSFKATFNILSPSLAELSGLPKNYGALIKSAFHTLLPGDFVLAIDGTALSEREGFQEILSRKKAGEKAKLKLLRSGQETEEEITL